jgi:hypothetical protein
MPKAGAHQYALGGRAAHLVRRLIHLSSILLLWLYYQFGANIARFFGLSLAQLIWLCLALVMALEALRLAGGWVVFGQRNYETERISAFTWGVIGMGLVLLFAPGREFAIPIICAYAIGDPLLGELRRSHLSRTVVIILGILVLALIWWLAHIWLNTPLWLVFIMPPLTLAAEWPCLHWIDDNALMQLIPLAVILFFNQINHLN